MLTAYRFSVTIGSDELGFQEISGIQRDSEVETYQEGGRNQSVLLFPKYTSKEQRLTLKKGVALNGTSPFYLVGEAIKSMEIKVYDHDGKTVCKLYSLSNLIICRWEVSSLHAMNNELLIDTFELAYGEIHAVS